MSAYGPAVAGLSIDFGQISERIPQAVVERILEETRSEERPSPQASRISDDVLRDRGGADGQRQCTRGTAATGSGSSGSVSGREDGNRKPGGDL